MPRSSFLLPRLFIFFFAILLIFVNVVEAFQPPSQSVNLSPFSNNPNINDHSSSPNLPKKAFLASSSLSQEQKSKSSSNTADALTTATAGFLNMADSTTTPTPSSSTTTATTTLKKKDEPYSPPSQVGILRVVGPDAKGLLAAYAQTLYGHGCGIIESEQHTDHECNKFFQRLKFDYSTLHSDRNALEVGIREVSERLNMTTSLNWNEQPKKIAIMVSKYDHALWELLLRHQAGELQCTISCILSNHADLQYIADAFSIPFHLFAIKKETKASVEAQELQLLKEHYQVDLVILARYMQIISDTFCNSFPHRVINIHHSFLPAFIGGKPYHRAHDRGVKLIGATAHYATADLDEGPIIEQDITRISHRDAVPDLIAKGRLLEKNVLVTAVKAHLEDRVIVFDNKCVVFDG